jgi:hypothetical protein
LFGATSKRIEKFTTKTIHVAKLVVWSGPQQSQRREDWVDDAFLAA